MKKNRAAVSLGRRGGKAKSDAKAAAARANGLKGGRPKKPTTVVSRDLDTFSREFVGLDVD